MSTRFTKTGGDAVVATLVANGIDTLFGIPGGHSLPAYAALSRCGAIRHVLGRHEQGLGYMADGFARASGRIAAVSITSGPAVANLACAMGQATTDTSPMLVIASTPRSDLVGRNKGGLHDLNDSLDLARAVCRRAEHCDTVGEISPAIARTIQSLRQGRAGCGYVQIPADVLANREEGEVIALGAEPVRPDEDLVHQAVLRLENAERPLILAGTGALNSEAGAVIRQLAEKLGAVVSLTALARGLVPGDLPYVIFPDGPTSSDVDEVYARADVVLAVGTMFKQEDTVNGSLPLEGKLIHVDVDHSEFGRNYPAELAIHGDARLTCECILERISRQEAATGDWVAFARQKQSDRLAKRRGRQGESFSIVERMCSFLPPDAAVFADRCNIGYWMFRCIPFHRPRTFHYPLGYGGLGGALPSAIGAKLAAPDKAVCAILGDGGMQFTLTELAVAVQEKAPIKVIVSNNRSFGAIEAGLRTGFGVSDFGTALSSPDYSLIAQAYGIPFVRCDTGDSFLEAFAAEMSRERLCLIEYRNAICDP